MSEEEIAIEDIWKVDYHVQAVPEAIPSRHDIFTFTCTFFVGGVMSTTVVYTVRLSFGEIPWFDEEGELRRCDWSQDVFFCMCPV